ncbi:uncharacterized protein UV8b_02906 [Ustilaginoidea virens]|uniref:DSBA-like thioredoxin domain-containing protein n=1 Tax=Ustilaginoidea virens TaxID=1159556 RepID=A0A8E5HNE2_USTVR|nr:uncharacterized protein UV8b_02906 [Ustilaginoidea virens]QUC18665.1 hypothetical protein UV8b_02906 [Ustilaginoidea virens]
MGTNRIDCYLDIASLYSYVCFEDMHPNLGRLRANGIEVEFHPVFLGGLLNLTGNKPPWTSAAKARYLGYDSPRAARRVGITDYAPPEDLLQRAKTQSALRALLFVKARFPRETFLSVLRFLLHRFWTPPHADVVDEASLKALLLQATETPTRGSRLFTEPDVDAIMQGRAEMKGKLIEDTGRLAEDGAFGCPWLVATNSRGEVEPFFGSDRFNHMYIFLGLPFQDVVVLEPGAKL